MKTKIIVWIISLLLFAGSFVEHSFAQWVHSGISSGYIQCFAVSGTNLFAGDGGGGVFRSTNNGASWTAVNSGLTNMNILSLAVSSNGQSVTNIFAGTWDGVFLSTNYGANWTAVNSGLTNTSVRSLVVSGTNLFAATGGGVFLSTNNGTSWTAVNSGLIYTDVYSLAISGSNLFAGTNGAGVFLSTNNGTSWTAVNSGLTYRYVSLLAVFGTNLFAATSSGIFLSTNNGTSWTAVNSGLTNGVSSLAASGTNIFAGTFGGGVFLSTNNGTSWTAVNSGLTNMSVSSLLVSGTNIFAGTMGGGVWRRALSEMITDVENLSGLPSHFVLEQNYPNPFNPSTTIRFAVPERSHVVIEIFNMLGQKVDIAINDEFTAGYYEMRWEPKLASGVYVYRMVGKPIADEHNAFIQTKQMVLVK